ncbi:hypothetical protein EK21DRAFT_88896 [Setomelanomma holmii]|uniref:Heterokaryon incompatibility domain-containing protein n=1 Tax=Setomelanomma holmii TaxID=210430 RepID=A0A9P4H9Z9_9PLEO|nr:hypothetical protein EK21DRAFT_88896 [Setomelanomma holmii]
MSTRAIRLVQVAASANSYCLPNLTTPEIILRVSHKEMQPPEAGRIWADKKHTIQRFRPREMEPPNFVALSYAWGDKDARLRRVYVAELQSSPKSDDVHEVLSDLDVRENLFQFLWYFRDSERNTTETRLWIDQLCIHQANVHERNHQVKLMASIYRSASYVVTWLGSSPEVMWAAEVVSTFISTTRRDITSEDRQIARGAAVRMLNNSYFTRLWIVQEVLLPRNVLIFSGIHWVPIDHLEKVNIYDTEVVTRVYNAAPYLIWDRIHGKSRSSRSLARCLGRYTGNISEDPRDRLYGLLGLADDSKNIEVDYSKAVYLVYYDGVKALYKDYYKKVRFDVNTEQKAGYVESALSLAKNMGMPDSVLQRLSEIEPNVDWIQHILPELELWGSIAKPWP